MRAYVYYKDKSIIGFKRLVNSGGGIFDKYRTLAVSFIKYAGSDLDKNLAIYDAELDINSIRLEDVFPKQYKWFVSDMALKSLREYLKSIEGRITEFEGGKEDNLKIMVGILFLRFVLLTKIVETYLTVASEMKKSGQDISSLTLNDIGIGKSLLKFFDVFHDFELKSVDDWLNGTIDTAAANYFYSSMKRILSILTSTDII